MHRRELAWLAVVAVVVRVMGWLALDYQLMGDARGYQTLATNLVERRVFSLSTEQPFLPSAFRPPLYPSFVALTQAVTGPGLVGVQLAQLALSVAAALLLAVAVQRSVRGPSSRLAAWALVLNPFDGSFVAAMLSETLSTFMVSATVASLALLRSSRRFLVAGLFSGLAALTRDLFIVLPVAIAAVLVMRGLLARRQLHWRGPLLVVVASTLVIMPWTVRNIVQFDKLIPVAAGGIEYGLWIGSWERTPDWVTGGIINYPDEAFPTPEHRARLDAMNGELYNDAARALLKEMTVANWKKDPAAALLRCFRRAPQTWLGTRSELFFYRFAALRERGSPTWKLTKATQWGLNAVIIGLGLMFFVAGQRLGRRANRLRWACLAPVFVTIASYLPMHSVESRYSQPVLQLFVLGAGLVTAAMLKTARSRWRGSKQLHLRAGS